MVAPDLCGQILPQAIPIHRVRLQHWQLSATRLRFSSGGVVHSIFVQRWHARLSVSEAAKNNFTPRGEMRKTDGFRKASAACSKVVLPGLQRWPHMAAGWKRK